MARLTKEREQQIQNLMFVQRSVLEILLKYTLIHKTSADILMGMIRPQSDNPALKNKRESPLEEK